MSRIEHTIKESRRGEGAKAREGIQKLSSNFFAHLRPFAASRLCLVAGFATLAGCSLFHSADEADNTPIKPSTTQKTYSYAQPVPAALQPSHRPVVQNQLPLIYLVESNGTVRVTNVETGEEIANFPVKESQIVRVESKGVLLANKPVIGAELAPGTYAIEMIPSNAVTSGAVESSQTITRAVTAAATKPATPKTAPTAGKASPPGAAAVPPAPK